MLVLIGPPFEGRNDQYAQLAELTGLVAYELRTKLKPDTWGVVRALADPALALELNQRLTQHGYRSAVVDPIVAHEPDRKVVVLRGIEPDPNELRLLLRGRSMSVPWGAVLVVVQGQVTLGEQPRGRGSSSSFRAVNPSAAELDSFRESMTAAPYEAYLAADIHFITVPWVARIDVRSFDFSNVAGGSPLEQLEQCVAWLVQQTGVRVDNGSRASSVNAYTDQSARSRSLTPPPSYGPGSRRAGDEQTPKFDAYSRLVAEAERQTRHYGRGSAPPGALGAG